MNPYTLSLWSLVTALLGQSLASGLAVELFLRREQAASARRAWLTMAIGSMLLALHHGYALELALRTGLYDLRQAVLSGLVALCFALGVWGLRRLQA